jgi:hypothetical protein
MVLSYQPRKPLQWDLESEVAFKALVDAINNAQKLFFYHSAAPVFLETDASAYCVGAFLYQLVDETRYPIRFISKALTGAQLRWHTYDKEGYAIFWAFKTLSYLLRDVHFTLRTDHANLTYVNREGSDRVYRWKLEFLEYDYDVEHYPGVKNIAGDVLSRQILHTHENEVVAAQVADLMVLEHIVIPDERYQLLKTIHNRTAGHFGVSRTIKKILIKYPNIPTTGMAGSTFT